MIPDAAPPTAGLHLQPADTIQDVIKTMQAIDLAVPDSDGLKWFNYLYLAVTQSVQAHADANTFEDPAWINRLDIVFANLYFGAVTLTEQMGPHAAARAWRPFFESRTKTGIARIQFALAGMNAHINRDLVVALLDLDALDGSAPGSSSARFRDFTKVNQLLEIVEQEVKPKLLEGTPLELGGHLAALEDILAMWSVNNARQAAWDHSQAFWHLRNLPALQKASLDSLDGLTQVAGSGFLLRVLS